MEQQQKRGPLAGVRVADFTEYIAGPYCGMMLADLGAEVLKIEPPVGDRWRQSIPVAPNEGRGFLQANRGKRGMVLDLKHPDGQAVAARIIKSSDVALVNGRPDVVKRLSLDYESMLKANPTIIYCQNTGFGTSGPYAHRGGFDLLAQSVSGALVYEASTNGSGNVTGVGATALGDYSAGLFMAMGICAALFARERDGVGQRIDMSLLDAAIASQYRPLFSIEGLDSEKRQMFLETREHLQESGGTIREMFELRSELLGARIENIYYRAYRSLDGYLTVACLNNELRRRLRDILELDDPSVEGAGYSGPPVETAARLSDQAEARFAEKTSEEWMRLLDRAGVPCGPLNCPEEVVNDPQVRVNGSILRLHHPTLGKLQMPANPLRFSATPVTSPTAPPQLGEETEAILRELGYGDGEVASLIESGAASKAAFSPASSS